MAERPWPDNVARWQDEIAPKYPGASFTFRAPWFFGSLAEDHIPLRRSDLGRLIDALIEREASGLGRDEGESS